jgi:serine/threonine protein kinase
MRQAADALSAAHGMGLVHRDLKPSNVMITEAGQVKLLDFGLARPVPGGPLDERSWSTVDGAILGTPAYMSPEQARGEPIGLTSDVFSFGAILYELLAGEAVFERSSVADTLPAVLTSTPAPLHLPSASPARGSTR